jgi:two-component system NtrC family response regulator
VVTINIPPLRDRMADTRLLAHAFLRRFAPENGRTSLKLHQDALRAIEQHNWPGNVRELENRIRRAVIMADISGIKPDDLELTDHSAEPPTLGLKEAREAIERQYVQNALRKHGGNITSAATELGVTRPTLYELMDRLGIQRD